MKGQVEYDESIHKCNKHRFGERICDEVDQILDGR